uniref:Reverse transcriptase (RNA-dependent DNA polymerase) n=1 Tax=Schistocephalus solidus TaxID=70667 RepID=A0A0X3PYT4_SCHSO
MKRSLSGPFVKVLFRCLLVQLEALGIGPTLLKFIWSYLSNRCQKGMVCNKYATPHSITRGVLQGPVLNPLIFLLLYNDIRQNVEIHKFTFSVFLHILRVPQVFMLIKLTPKCLHCLNIVNSGKWSILRSSTVPCVSAISSFLAP